MSGLLRLKDDAAFQRVYREGRSWTTSLLILRASPNGLPHSRIGYTTSKRLGSAVSRNRVKRRMREAFRAHAVRLAPGWDLVLIAREPSRQAAFAQLERAVAQLLVHVRLPQPAGPAGKARLG